MKNLVTIITLLAISCPLVTGKPTLIIEKKYATKGNFSIPKDVTIKADSLPTFKRVYALGDSFSDNGNLQKLTENQQPNVDLYYKGRFSNGPVWVEQLSKKLDANLTNLAYASATTDNDMYSAPLVPEKYYVPGCIQQVKILNQDLPDDFEPDSSLITVAFLGNDFFKLADSESYMSNMKICLNSLLKSKKYRHVLVATSNAPEIFPAYKKIPEFLIDMAINDFIGLPESYGKLISELESDYPDTKIYNFDLADTIRSVANKTLPLPNHPTNSPVNFESCLISTKLALFTPADTTICKDPDNHIFWDAVHPTTNMHQVIAEQAMKTLH